MTRHPLVQFTLALAAAVSLAACGGGSPGVDETAAEAGVSPTAPDDGAGTDGDTDAQDEDADDGQPGGPGDDGEDGGDGGGDGGDGGGNPGGPGDVLVFEESNVEYGEFRDEGSGHRVCVVEGSCTLAEPDIIEGEADPETGVDFCLISTFEYSSGVRTNPDPEGPRDVFTEGATVTAQLKCPEPEETGTSEAEESEAEESESEESESEESESEESESEESESEEIPADESPADSGDGSEG
jgi:hypothetical protein